MAPATSGIERAMSRLTPELAEEHRAADFWRDALIDGFITEVAEREPDSLAIVDRGRRVTYGELERRIVRFAACLRAHGLVDRDVVSYQLPNWTEAVVVHHGTLRAGGISNPIVPIYREREVGFILSQAGSRFAVIPDEFRKFSYRRMYDKLRDSVDSIEQLWVVGDSVDADASFAAAMAEPWEKRGGGSALADVERSADDPALLLYTSGTTADPKGVVHTHNTLHYENRSIIDIMRLGPDDVVFMPSPVTHITGVLYGLQLPAMLGCPVIFQDVWDATEALRLIAEERASFAVGATPFLHGLTYHDELSSFDVSSLSVFACGGADVPPALITDTTERLGCASMRVYGSSEYPTLTASPPEAPIEKRSRTDGRVIADAEARIVDDKGVSLPPGHVGELLARGPEMFIGYLGGDPSETFTPDGWFPTGDLAVMDDDGYVEIKGRKKDIIVRGGENISAKEVEDLLFSHPSVAEVAVVAYPDPIMSERACAVVVPVEGRSVELDDLVQFLRSQRLTIQKCPERVKIVDALPKTASGKVQKFILREELAEEVRAENDTAHTDGP